MDEQRIIEFETRLAYQEHTLAELNDVMTDQQSQLTRLEKLVRVLGDQLEAMERAPAAATAESEKPPHY